MQKFFVEPQTYDKIVNGEISALLMTHRPQPHFMIGDRVQILCRMRFAHIKIVENFDFFKTQYTNLCFCSLYDSKRVGYSTNEELCKNIHVDFDGFILFLK